MRLAKGSDKSAKMRSKSTRASRGARKGEGALKAGGGRRVTAVVRHQFPLTERLAHGPVVT